jgi:His-Xaa-Ser system protein HxsD
VTEQQVATIAKLGSGEPEEHVRVTAGVRERAPRPTAFVPGHGSAGLEVDLSIFSLPAILRACYKLTDRCYAFVARAPEAAETVVVTLGTKVAGQDVRSLTGELANELIDQQLREELAREAGPIRELLVAQAFAEGNLLDPDRDDADYREDPRGIGGRR